MLISGIATLALFISSQTFGRPFLWPALFINFGLCLIAGGVAWHFLPREITPTPKPITSLPLKETGRILLEPGKNKKAFSVDNTNPDALTYKEVPETDATVKSNSTEPPNVLNVFVHDINILDMSGTIFSAHVDLDIGPNKFRVFYYAIYNFQANSKYLSVFISYSPYTFGIVQGLSQGYKKCSML
jgi:hypothetical protein